MWVLQRGDGALEDRLARAYLEELASAEEAKKTSGRLLGKTANQHQDQAAQFKCQCRSFFDPVALVSS